jgi:hypothetical protein
MRGDVTRLPNPECREYPCHRDEEVITFDISARFIIFSAAIRLSSSVQPEAIIRARCQVSRNLPETQFAVRT